MKSSDISFVSCLYNHFHVYSKNIQFTREYVMRSLWRYCIYFIAIILIIFLINFILNFVIGLPTPFSLKIAGDIDSWISFNGNLLGSIFGGVIAGLIAYSIAKYQIDQNKKNEIIVNEKHFQYQQKINKMEQLNDILYLIHVNLIHEKSFFEEVISLFKHVHKNQNENLTDTKERINKISKYLEDEYQQANSLGIKTSTMYMTYIVPLYQIKSELELIMKTISDINRTILFLQENLTIAKENVNKSEPINPKTLTLQEKYFTEFVERKNIFDQHFIRINEVVQNTVFPNNYNIIFTDDD